jgi:hypothetical protein
MTAIADRIRQPRCVFTLDSLNPDPAEKMQLNDVTNLDVVLAFDIGDKDEVLVMPEIFIIE